MYVLQCCDTLVSTHDVLVCKQHKKHWKWTKWFLVSKWSSCFLQPPWFYSLFFRQPRNQEATYQVCFQFCNQTCGGPIGAKHLVIRLVTITSFPCQSKWAWEWDQVTISSLQEQTCTNYSCLFDYPSREECSVCKIFSRCHFRWHWTSAAWN